MSTTDNGDGERVAEYVAWLKANGATFDAIVWPHTTPNTGRGAVLTKPMKRGEPFLSVPSKLIINAPRCRQDPAIGPFLSRHGFFTSSDELTLAVFLLHEQLGGRESFWFPYISTLPRDTGCLGRTWTAQELAELQDEQFVEEVSVMVPNERNEQYQALVNLLGDAPKRLTRARVTYEAFSWAMEIVLSRVFGRRIEHMSLVPLADNLNHSNVGVKYAISAEDDRFRLYPTVDISVAPGEVVEAFNSYGRRSNANLLMGYGFAIPNNEWDDVQLELQLPPMASQEKKRMFDNPGPFIAQFRAGQAPEAFLRFFRLVYAAKHDVARMNSFSQGGFQFVSRDNERAVVRTCKNELEGLLSSFPTSEEEDVDLLSAQHHNSDKLTFAILYRLGRKRALYFSLHYLVKVQAWLDVTPVVTEEAYFSASQAVLVQLKE